MLSRIRGKIIEFGENKVIIDVNGLGFEVLVPNTILKDLMTKVSEEEVTLVSYFYLQVTPSRANPVLIGFNSEEEKEFFEEFISVASIGPKSAVKSLIYPFSQIALAIDTGDEAKLKGMPGIGARKVKEIIAKLQGKVTKFITSSEHYDTEKPALFIPGDIRDDALEVLIQLQFTKSEALKKIEKALQKKSDVKTSQELISLIMTM